MPLADNVSHDLHRVPILLQDPILLNSVLSGRSTGGSIVVDKSRADKGEFDRQKTYKVDRRPIECITLSEIVAQYKRSDRRRE